MKIVGQKYLNRNDYSTITIGKDKITILGKDSYPTIKGDGTSITDEIKNLPLNEQVGGVVDYFLRYTTVCSIIDNDYVSFINDVCQIVKADCDLKDLLTAFHNMFSRKLNGKTNTPNLTVAMSTVYGTASPVTQQTMTA